MEETLSTAELFGQSSNTGTEGDVVSSADIFGSGDVVSSASLFKPEFTEPPFMAKHPSLYAAAKTAADMVPYLKYIDPEERERFSKLATNEQTRELLRENLDAVIMTALPAYGKALSSVAAPLVERFLPKTYQFFTKSRTIGSKPTPQETPPTTPVSQKTPEVTPEVKPPEIADLEVKTSAELMTEKPVAEVMPEVKVASPAPEIVQPGADLKGKRSMSDDALEYIDNARRDHVIEIANEFKRKGAAEVKDGNLTYIVHKSTKEPGKIQVSVTDERGPMMDFQADDLRTALTQLTEDHLPVKRYSRPDLPDTALMDVFPEGGEYTYSYRARPMSIGTQPEGFIRGEEGGKWGKVVYDRPLTAAEIKQFELTPEKFTEKPPSVLKDYPELASVPKSTTPSKGVTPTGNLDILAKEQAAQRQAGKVGLDIGKKESQPTYTFAEPETEKLFQSAKGIKPDTIATKIKAVATEIGHKFTRDFEHLANKKENAQLIFDLKRLEKQKDVVADRTTRSIGETLSGLNKAEYDLFNRKVVLDDLISDYNRGLYVGEKELPFKFRPDSLAAEKGKLDALIQTNPKIAQALEKRTAMWDQVKNEYVEALGPYKPGVEDMFRENYYRHQVLDYVATNGIFGTGKRLRAPQKGYMKGRTGAANLYNTDYLEAEHQIMAQMLHDAETAKTLTKIKTSEDIAAQIRAQAKESGIDDWHKAIPEGYTAWQPKEGSVFHPVLTVDEKTAAKIMEGEIDEILGSGKDIFKEALAVGGKRKEWVVRQEVADTLNNLVRERSKGIVSAVDLNVMSAWKKWQLIQPRRYFKYNVRNLTGDAEATFLGNASGFKKAPRAIRELGSVFFGKKPMTEDMAKWFERGGMSSTLQAQEMDALKPLWMFSRLYEQKGGSSTLWEKYWSMARLTTDFRESILRYANYLDFKEQLVKNGGKPLKYGASKPEMIDGLKDIDDKAFWLSNDLLGAYDRVSVAGQTIRERAIPFWSWQEVNFKRYIQLFRNAANDGELATAIGKKFGTSTVIASRKVGSLAIKMSAFASALAVYNHTRFPEEEKQLPLDVRTKPHIILGRDEKGDIQYFNRMGTLDDFISWFGMDYAPRIVGQYLNGDKTWKETLQEQAKETMHAPVNKVIGGAVPFTKLAGELISRKSAFPDIFQAGTIRDRYLHIARSFGLENEYIAMAGKPSRGYGQSLKNTFIYTVNPGEAAYRTVFDLKNDFLKKLGKTSEGFWLTPTGDALYNMKLSMKYGDKQAFTKYFTEYISLAQQQGRTPEQIRQGMKSAIKSMDPLNGLNDQMKASFINGLNKDNQDALLQAYQFYKDVLSGEVQ